MSDAPTDATAGSGDPPADPAEPASPGDAGSDDGNRWDVDDAVLGIDGLTKQFGGITAVDDASFAVERGSITGLIGPNGAGKSTTFDLVTGFTRPDAGTVVFDDTDVAGLQPYQIARRGLVRTFQLTRIFPEMTVLENLMVAPPNQRGESLVHSITPGLRGGVVEQERELAQELWNTLEFFEIDHLADGYAKSLSGGQRKLLELARAMLVEPELLLLDEPMAGVNPSLEEKLLDRIHDLRSDGYTFLIVEHDMDLIMEHCDRVIVMHQGQVIAEGDPAAVRQNERVIEAYLGGDV